MIFFGFWEGGAGPKHTPTVYKKNTIHRLKWPQSNLDIKGPQFAAALKKLV